MSAPESANAALCLACPQQQLAVMIGVTYQQAHKYERGLNRISAGRLYDIAQVLNVPISWFFEGMEIEAATGEMNPRQRMCLELARNFALIDNLKHQEALSMMARALAHAETVPPEGGPDSGSSVPQFLRQGGPSFLKKRSKRLLRRCRGSLQQRAPKT